MSLLTRPLRPIAFLSLCTALTASLAVPAHAGVKINWEALDALRSTQDDTPLILRNPATGQRTEKHPGKVILTPPRPAVPRVSLAPLSTPPLPLAAPSMPVDISAIPAPQTSTPTPPAPLSAALETPAPHKTATPIAAPRAPLNPVTPAEAVLPAAPILAEPVLADPVLADPVLTPAPGANAEPTETASIAPAVPGSESITPAKRIQLASLKTHNEPNNTRPVTERGVLAAPALAQILFEGESVALHGTAKEHLNTLADELSQQSDRIELQAFGGAAGDRSIPARRLSLKRALAVRAYLIALGVGSNRIDVHALGGVRDDGPANRVDIVTSHY